MGHALHTDKETRKNEKLRINTEHPPMNVRRGHEERLRLTGNREFGYVMTKRAIWIQRILSMSFWCGWASGLNFSSLVSS